MIKSLHNYLKYSAWCKPEYDEIIQNQIENSDIVIIGTSWCPWTRRAKKLVKDEYKITPTMLTSDVISQEYQVNLLYCMCKRVNTVDVPQIWIKGQHIGDFEHLYKMHMRKQIEPMLNTLSNKTI